MNQRFRCRQGQVPLTYSLSHEIPIGVTNLSAAIGQASTYI